MAMMFSGYGKKPRFGDVSYGTPPIYDPTEQSLPASEPAAKPGFFAHDGLGVNILGGIADAVSTGFGGAPVFGQQQAKRDQWTQTLQMKALERKQALDQWQQQQIWKQEHPDPVAPHYWETNDGSLGVVGADGKPTIAYKDPTPKVDYTPVKNPDGTTTLYPTINGQMVGAGQQQPAATGLPQGFSVRPKGGAGPGQRPFP